MLDKFDQILARGGSTAGGMDLQQVDFSELRERLLPFLGRQFAAATLQFDGVGAIGALQRTAMCYLRKHRERNPKSLRRRAALLQHRKPVTGVAGRCAGIDKRRTHGVFSRASVKNPFSASSCSMAITSPPIAPPPPPNFSPRSPLTT